MHVTDHKQPIHVAYARRLGENILSVVTQRRVVASALIFSILTLDVPMMPNTEAADVDPALWVTVPVSADPMLQGLTIPADAPTKGMWSNVKSWPLNALHATILPDGQVLSYGSTPDGTGQIGRYFDLWDPTLGFGTNSHQTTYRAQQQDTFCSTAVYLTNGSLLISGGNGGKTSTIYTPSSNAVQTSGNNLALDRWYASMITLPDGRPIMLGGMVPYAEDMRNNPDLAVAQGLPSMTPEIFESNGWRSLFGAYSREAFGPDYLRTSYPRAFVAPNGQVFGISAEKMWYLNPNGNGSINIVGNFKGPYSATSPVNVGSTNNAVMFAPGKILVLGGNGGYNEDPLPASNMATVVDINGVNPVLTEQTPMTFPRRMSTSIVLSNGQVVVTGGTRYGNSNGANAVFAAEIWNSETGSWTTGANAAIYRGYHSNSLLMPNGAILSFGGGTPGPVTNLNAEVYYPPYLFRPNAGGAVLATRPVIQAISGLSYNHEAPMQMDMTNTNTISSLVLVGLSNGTHAFNAGQRRIPLTFTQQENRLTTTTPNANLAPPGYYQVVALDANGVPSLGAIVAIGQNVAPPAVPTTPYNPPDIGGTINAPIINSGNTASYSVSATTGTTYSWNFGDGSPDTPYNANPAITHTYSQPGVYVVTLSARDAVGAISRRTFLQAVATSKTAKSPTNSTAIALETRAGNPARIWTVNPDNDSVNILNSATNELIGSVNVGLSPRSVAVAPDGRIWVTNKKSASISIISPTTLSVVQTLVLPRASQPHGIAFDPNGTNAFVALEALGRLIKLNASSGAQEGIVDVAPNIRHIAINHAATQVLVSRFITPPALGENTATPDTTNAGGEVYVVNPSTMAILNTVKLSYSDKPDSSIQGGGLPNYLASPVISPDGTTAWIPSKQDNIKRGLLRNGLQLDFQNTVRAITSRINMGTLTEDFAKRIDHDNSSVGSAAVYHPSGVYMFVALETSRQVAVVDAIGGRELFRLEVGRAPQGLAISQDGKTLYVQEFMDRSISVYDLSLLLDLGKLSARLTAVVFTSETEKLPANVILGKQLFYDAKDTRLSRDSYMSCASCHNDGGQDGRVWDLTGFGEGLRNTIALKGRAGMGHGFLHWSANFDEVQDFERQIRELSGGSGLMTDAQYSTGTRNQPLGDTKAGISANLDELAAYVTSLNNFDETPYRDNNAGLTTDATAGKALFQSNNCASCHDGSAFTISGNASTLRNIGTIKTTSGKRLNNTLSGIDVPTLRDAWATAPYLHDGSASTLSAAIQAHNNVTLNAADMAKVVQYVLQLNNRPPYYDGIACANENQTCTIPAGVTATVWFGAVDQWSDKTGVTGSIVCNSGNFGDPAPFVVKSCVYKLTTETSGNSSPTVSMTSPVAGASFVQGTAITLSANAADTDGTISQVQFYDGATLIGTDTTAPYSISWTNAAVGAHSITARATDNGNAVTISTAVAITVTSTNVVPTVSVTSPAAGASFIQGNAITVSANAADTDGTVSQVQFYDGAALIGTDATAPYSISWTNAAVGAHSITARATDNSNAVTTSAAVSITVTAPYAPPADAVRCAGEGETCTLPNGITATVWFGADTLWNNITGVSSSIACNNTVFGDPVIGVAKSCFYKITGGTPSNTLPTVALTSPLAGASFELGNPIALSATATDTDGTINQVEFYDGQVLIGVDITAPYGLTWSNATAGNHNLTARAYDNTGATTNSATVIVTVTSPNGPPGDAVQCAGENETCTLPNGITATVWYGANDQWANRTNVTGSIGCNNNAFGGDPIGGTYKTCKYKATSGTPANVAPTVSVTSPAAGASFTQGTAITVSANAADTDGTVSQVQFYDGATLIGTDATAPYSISWTNAAVGAHSITARATDNSNAVTTSAAVSITVNAANNVVPTVSVTSPAAGASFTQGTAITVSANAADTDGTVSQVQFYDGATLIGTDATAPYSISWTNAAVGAHSITARATDNSNAVTTSAAVSITVNAANNVVPTVSVTSPAAGASFTQGTAITVSANAADTDGTVSQVQFYDGATLIGTDATAPYSISWTNAAVGAHSITARATDNSNAVTTSAAVSITVNAANNVVPTVSVTSPAAGASFTQGTAITVSANAADTDGTVSQVQFYDGATLIGTDVTAPYSISWTNAAVGAHSITARATDNSNAVTTSAAVSITVNADVAIPGNPPADAIECAGENQTCTLPAGVTATVWYGANNQWAFRTNVTGSTACSNNAFGGDPIQGTYKTCKYKATSGTPANVAPTVSVTSPAAGASFTQGTAITVSANAADTDGTVSQVQFYDGATLIGTDATAPYSISWTNAAVGAHSITARATDNSNAVTTSAAVSITVNAANNVVPTVSVTSPAAGASFTQGTAITVSANAADTDGTVSQVQFYDGATLIGTDATAPYSISWTNAAVGAHSITARATDNSNAVTTSAAVSITVNAANNVVPTVSVTSPAAGASFTQGTAITVSANAADTDGTVSQVQFYDGATLIGTDVTAPYSISWTNAAVGAHSITARATDNSNAVTTSAAVSITVNADVAIPGNPPADAIECAGENQTCTLPAGVTATVWYGANNQWAFRTNVTGSTACSNNAFGGDPIQGTYKTCKYKATSGTPANVAPTVSVTSPAAGASFTQGTAITVSANAADTDGTVSQVQFYDGATLIGTDATAPYSISWTNAAVGAHSITARATDNSNAVTTSAAVSITVNAANNVVPTVSVTSPAAGASFTQGTAITVSANAADTDGTVSQVQFYDGATLIGTDATAPYSISWTNAAVGAHSITARATDNSNAVTTSAAVSITVTSSTPTTPGTGTGLVGDYYATANLTGNVVFQRVENINYDWETASPGAGLPADDFSIRWTGYIEATVTGAYQFLTYSDDGVRVYINNQLVINNWNPHAATLDTSSVVNMIAGQRLPITIEYYELGGNAVMEFYWRVPGTSIEDLVPAAQLYSAP